MYIIYDCINVYILQNLWLLRDLPYHRVFTISGLRLGLPVHFLPVLLETQFIVIACFYLASPEHARDIR